MEQNWVRKPQQEPLTEQIKQGVTFLIFPALEAAGLVRHGFSTRLGGVSKGVFAALNFTFNRGDHPADVRENYRRMAQALEIEEEWMVLSAQTHTTNVRKVTAEDAGKGLFRERDYEHTDGLITNVPGITLVTFYADCVPLYILDPVHQAIGLSHSGWRGTAAQMGQVTVQAMQHEYQTRPEDLIVCIGPSICQDCYEVGEEVAAAFKSGFDVSCHHELLESKRNGKYQLNLWRANELIFQEAGVRPENIHITDICTHCNPGLLFSHRAAGNERGNLAAFLCLARRS